MTIGRDDPTVTLPPKPHPSRLIRRPVVVEVHSEAGCAWVVLAVVVCGAAFSFISLYWR